ncbi:MAG: hypothetical protein OEY33_08455, partial [Bdellovibrionales bacterium]|nr:hypothetical protein [Bdellovibrionales bacterium]
MVKESNMADENVKDPSDLKDIEEEVEIETDEAQAEESSQDLSEKTEAKEYQNDDPNAEDFNDLSNVHYGGEKVNAATPSQGLAGIAAEQSQEEQEEQ